MEMKQKAPAGSAGATARKSQSITKRKMSSQQEQYFKVIHMSSAELGAALRAPTNRIDQHVRKASVHDADAKEERAKARREFQENIGFYYEAKQRLLNPGYRTDVDGGKERTPAENEKNFGAPNWAAFNEKCAAYSLQHADRLLNAFAKANGVLTDEGENIDDPEPKEDEGAGGPQPRRTEDPTAQKRYEFIAAAAMEIANRNPEGDVEKQILAAAEHVPAPLFPLPTDVFTEVLNFLTNISSSHADGNVRAEAKQLVNKMRLHQPASRAAEVPAEVAKEEKRKRDKRLAKKNGQPLGAPASDPPTETTNEHVQELEPTPAAASLDSGTGTLPSQDCTQAGPAEPIPGPGAEPPRAEAASGERIKAAGAQDSRPAPFSPGDWVTFDPACISLGRIEKQEGKRVRASRYNNKSNEWSLKPTLVDADKIHNRLTLEEVDDRFPCAHEAWLLARPQNAKPGPACSASSKIVYEPFTGGPMVREVPVVGNHGDVSRLNYHVCDGDQSHSYRTLDEAKAACDKIAGEAKHQESRELAAGEVFAATPEPPSDRAAEPKIDAPAEGAPTVPTGPKSVPQMGEVDQDQNARPGGELSAPSKTVPASAKPYHVKKRRSGNIVDFAVFRNGERSPEEIFTNKPEAEAFCDRLNAPVTGIVPPLADPRSAAQSAG